uniref:Uncharacterized protein n=1 Tax=Arundo donax TaxID=35708 RepID=A0A0A9H442_ARUDO
MKIGKIGPCHTINEYSLGTLKTCCKLKILALGSKSTWVVIHIYPFFLSFLKVQ